MPIESCSQNVNAKAFHPILLIVILHFLVFLNRISVIQSQHIPFLVFLLKIDMVPVVNEVPDQITHRWALEVQSNIVPRHSLSAPWDAILLKFNHICYINHPVVIVLNSRVHFSISDCHIMLLIIEPPVANVETSHKGNFLVDDHHFFMVSPQSRKSCQGMP